MTSSAAPYDTATTADANTMAMTYEEAMDDVHTRFILNLPDDELRSAPRIFFQLEQAWWFYDDFICDGAAAASANNNNSSNNSSNTASNATAAITTEELPRYKHVKPFSYAMFQFSPLLQPMLPHFDTMYDEFTQYKRSISTYGTILLNEAATQVALVRPWKSKSWTFPGGKVNQNESGYDAACRETYEETGFDPLVEPSVQPPPPPPPPHFSNTNAASPTTVRENSKLSYTERESNKQRTCYICRGVPTNFPFEPVARKEVSEVKWFDIASLPKQKTYAVLPFYNQLREWIKKDNKARGIHVRDEDRGGRRRRPEDTYCDDDDDEEEDDDDDGELAPFFSDDGKAPWEQEEEKDRDDGAELGTDVNKDIGVVSNNSSGNSVDGPSSTNKRRNNKHEKQPRRDSSGSSSNNKGRKQHEKQQQQQQQKKDRRSTPPRASSTTSSRGGSTGRPRGGSTGRRRGSSGEEALLSESDPLVKLALATPGESRRWTEDEMFAANEKLLGRKITYDGNPHEFAAGGWGSGIIRDDKEVIGGREIVDPHAFHVVGGSFMNSEASAAAGGAALSSLLAPPPDASKLQPLVNARAMTPGSMVGTGGSGGGDDGLELTPFFSDNGRAPWEEVNDTLGGGTNSLATKDSSPPHFPVQGAPLGRKNSKGLALLNKLRQGGITNDDGGDEEEGDGVVQSHVAMMAEVKDDADIDEWFMTDKEITAKSQTKKLSMMSQSSEQAASLPHVGQHDVVTEGVSPPNDPNEHLVWMKNWAQQLPQAGPTKAFGDFRLDVDSIMNVMTATVAHKT
ncbi:hypothetical protein ACHAWU_005832 [Discostella pseudostelligera]|uniref:Nudix hydrolase domain-containing protein n=1 Tax=Discostella pseudostelligera TaxID=259834 RepID=A0ABD3MZZ4_9STRA